MPKKFYFEFTRVQPILDLSFQFVVGKWYFEIQEWMWNRLLFVAICGLFPRADITTMIEMIFGRIFPKETFHFW